MIALCKQMIIFYSESKSIFADVDKKTWEEKLKMVKFI